MSPGGLNGSKYPEHRRSLNHVNFSPSHCKLSLLPTLAWYHLPSLRSVSICPGLWSAPATSLTLLPTQYLLELMEQTHNSGNYEPSKSLVSGERLLNKSKEANLGSSDVPSDLHGMKR